MRWLDVLDESRLPEGAREVVEVEGAPILLIRYQGQIYAVAARCPHLGASLKDGRITNDGFLVCPRHRSAFSLQSGEVAEWSPWPPGVGRMLGVLRREHALPVYPVRTENGRVWIEI